MAFALTGWSNVWAEYSPSNEKIYFTWDGSSGYTVSFGEGVSGDIAITETMEMTDGTYTWEGAITGISSYTNLSGNTGITSLSINLPSATSIPERAFENCTNLEWIWLPYVTSIGEAAFKGCTKLTLGPTSIPVVETIGASAFYGCTGLTSMEFPSSLSSIGDYAFQNCDNLTSITSYSNGITLGTEAFKGNSSWNYIAANCVLKVPDGCTANYAANTFDGEKTWTYFDEFYTNHNIHELTYPSITTAGWGTYYNTYGYTMPAGVEGYIITSTAGTTANLVKVYDPGDEVVADIALLWKSTSELDAEKWFTVEALSSGGATASWPVDGESNPYTTLLNGSQAGGTTTYWGSESDDYYYYKLSYNNSGENLGWYFAAEKGAAFESDAHKAWMFIKKSPGARSFIRMFDEPTGVNEVISKKEDVKGTYYDLSGRRVMNPTKGLYIVNGKKILK